MTRFLIVVEGEHSEDGPDAFNRITGGLADSLKTSGYVTKDAVFDWDREDERQGKPRTETSGEVVAVEDLAPDEPFGRPLMEEIAAQPPETLAATMSVDFASAAAAELADELDLTDADFAEWEPTGKTGFTVSDVRHIAGSDE